MAQPERLLRHPARRPCPWTLAVAGLVLLGTLHASSAALGQDLGPLPDNVMEGWKVFARKQCIQCHAVCGLGGQVGPDLGRTEQQGLTAGKLAGTLWNHIPTMYSHMLQHRVDYPRLTPAEVSDLFSFLFFVRYLDEPGNPAVGERLLRQKGCAQCHATEGRLEESAPDLKRWAGYGNPIVWAQKMWERAPAMEQAMQRAGVTWPQLDDRDLVNIIAYLRSIGGQDATIYLQPGSAKTGARLFVERKCQSCHYNGGPGKDLAATPPPRSLAGLASRMWNHSPEMTRLMRSQGIERSPLTAQEMADITAYVIFLRYEDRGGNPQRGRKVLEAKQCTQCHLEASQTGSAAPGLQSLGAVASPVRLADAMWNHGLTMMARMSERGLNWPVFQGDEMVDLIAYLKSLAPPEQPAAAAAAALPVPEAALRIGLPPIEPGASCVTNACHPGIVAGRVVHAPAAQGECTVCHTVVNPLTHEMQLVAHSSALCYQCHDEPVDTMKLHGPVALGVCTACHNPHSADNLFGPDFTGNETCFAGLVGLTDALDTLVGGTQRPTPKPSGKEGATPEPAAPARREPAPPVESTRSARPLAASVPRLPADRAAPGGAVSVVPAASPPTSVQTTCVTSECHATLVAQQFMHPPSAQKQCEACHSLADEAAHRFQLTAKEPELCYQCHDRPPAAAFQHGPVALGMCTVCHNPHSAPQKFMLPEVGKNLCLTCHDEMAQHLRSVRVPHGAIDQNGCTPCHDPHRADLRYQLKANGPDLCLKCHRPIREIIETASVNHEPVTTDKACLNCHNPHGSDVPKMLTDVEMDLCLSCHDKPMDTPNGPIINMKDWIARNPERHGPIRNRNCTGCHQPHGSQNFRILQYAFPRTFYSPFSLETYALCFQCHEETLVLDERTTTLTDFRNGEKNLHYVHVNQFKGRTCRACHEIHAGTQPKRIKDFVPYGAWEYPVNFQKNDFGGRCAPACHVERAYDRRKEVVQK